MPDLLVVGAGPAGCAAAIQACRAGLSVTVLEASERLRPVPGETLHPGIEPIFERLGVRQAIIEANFHRHRGVWVEWDRPRHFVPYGRDQRGDWFGFQAVRHRLHGILLDAARRAGAEVELGRSADELIFENGGVQGVVTNGRELRARWTADGTGRQAFIPRMLGLTALIASPPLRACFGWIREDAAGFEGQPQIAATVHGWEWWAPLGDSRSAWVSLTVDGTSAGSPPRAGVDLSWRHCAASAGPGYILLGDAASTFDPASSHGVLRALMSGMLCAHLVYAQTRAGLSKMTLIAQYRYWIREQFEHDVRELRALYCRHPFARVADLFTATDRGDTAEAIAAERMPR